MQKILKPAIIALACLAALGAYAQTATVTPPVATGTATVAAPSGQLSLADCIAYATANQPDYQAALLNLQSSGSQLTQSQASYMPTVSVENNDLHIEDPKKNVDYGTSLKVTHTFYDSGLRDVSNQQAHASLSNDEAAFLRTKQKLDYDVTNAYVTLLITTKLLDVTIESLKYTQEQYDVLSKRVAVGDAARVDLLPLEVQLASSKVAKLSAENNIRKAKVALENIIGIRLSSQIEIQDISKPVVKIDTKLDDYLKIAQEQRPEMHQAQLSETIAELNLKSSKINRGPKFHVDGNYGMDIDSKMAHNWSVTGVISYNIFDGNLLKAREDEAGHTLDATRQRSIYTFNNVQSDVWNAYLNLQNAIESKAATDMSLRAAEENSRAQRARQLAGLGTPLDVTNAVSQLASARNDSVTNQYNYILALAQMNFALGKEGIQL